MIDKQTPSSVDRVHDVTWDMAASMISSMYVAQRLTIQFWQSWLEAFTVPKVEAEPKRRSPEQPSGLQEMFRVANDAFARTENAVRPRELSKESAPAPEATRIVESAPPRPAVVQPTETPPERRPVVPVETRRAPSTPVQGFPRSTGRDALIEAIVKAANTDADQAARAVDAILGTITTALAQGEEVRVPGFGSFKVIQTQSRLGRNPRTNEPISIPEGHRAVFRPGSDLRKAVTSS